MKKFVEKFKALIRFIVTVFASREFGFIYCLLGTVGQVSHTYFLTESISSFSGGFKIFQAVLISGFISSSLLYFVAIADNVENKENRKIHWAINIFCFIEVLINFYYYSRHLIIDSKEVQIFDFIFAVLVSCLIPITIKLYGGLIKAREWMNDISNNKVEEKQLDSKIVDLSDNQVYQNNAVDLSDIPTIIDNHEKEDIEKIVAQKIDEFRKELESQEKPITKEKINMLIDEKFNSIKQQLNSEILQSFKKNQDLFLNQFINKCKMIVKSSNIEE